MKFLLKTVLLIALVAGPAATIPAYGLSFDDLKKDLKVTIEAKNRLSKLGDDQIHWSINLKITINIYCLFSFKRYS